MISARAEKALFILLVILITASALLHLLRPIADYDFFWHLKTGEWIWQEKALPSVDPFAYTTPTTQTIRERIILTSYWLSQVILYLGFAAAGMEGIAALRFLIAGLLIAVMLKRMQGDRILYLGLLAVFVTQLLESYAFERPQVFSFLFFALLLLLLEQMTAAEKETGNAGWFIPPVMLVWANTHGGFILGQVIIILFVFMEGIKFVHPALNPVKKGAYVKLLAAGTAGLLASLANPNTWHILTEMRNVPSYMSEINIEYMSSLDLLRRMNDYSVTLFWSILLLAGAGIVLNIRRLDITNTSLLVAIGIASFLQVRYIAFFLIAALPAAAKMWSGERVLRWSRVFVIIIALFAVLYFTWDESGNTKFLRAGDWISRYVFPVHAAEFVASQDLRGKMYNHYNWGGYLIWRLGPERKVFIDGRNIYPEIYSQAALIDSNYGKQMAGVPFWKSLLNAYGVRYVIVPLFAPSGQMLPLVDALLRDQEWVPVFFQLNSLIFIKDTEENAHVKRRFAIPKDYFINDLIEVCNRLLRGNPGNVSALIAKGDLYVSKRDFDLARDAYEKASEIAPFNTVVRSKLKDLERFKRP